ncbi:DNA-3-methyladenine glycosylase I [Salinisphaera sp. LB1]|uniref:DNA-3-methyladenine glycosylase I n=1 Tax=Salinisphaera sp. LB1 TaxID=2183911 RepID=UPI000D705C29|nr:DNA-3-methyladenine glycosylase I [Salinisphaera sp. LB1]AWN16433.1 DNA-3-methyladenine glycosylase [Salinisphaera sp. LB1]
MNSSHADSARCAWARSHPLLAAYHDAEWGVPETDPRALWEKLMLDGFQAGLSWLTILRKRQAFRQAFAEFDPERVARFESADIDRLMANPGIVRSRAKIEAVIGNARAYLAMQAAGEDFAAFVWSFVDHRVRVGDGRHVPTETERSRALTAALKKRGFKYVGPTIVYAWMQATGLVNDHALSCFRRDQV